MWNEKITKLITEIYQWSYAYFMMYSKASKDYENYQNNVSNLNLAIICINGLFAGIPALVYRDDIPVWINIIIFVLSVLNGLIFKKMEALSNGTNKQTYDNLTKDNYSLFSNIRRQLSLPTEQRQPGEEYFSWISKDYDRLNNNNILDEKYYEWYEPIAKSKNMKMPGVINADNSSSSNTNNTPILVGQNNTDNSNNSYSEEISIDIQRTTKMSNHLNKKNSFEIFNSENIDLKNNKIFKKDNKKNFDTSYSENQEINEKNENHEKNEKNEKNEELNKKNQEINQEINKKKRKNKRKKKRKIKNNKKYNVDTNYSLSNYKTDSYSFTKSDLSSSSIKSSHKEFNSIEFYNNSKANSFLFNTKSTNNKNQQNNQLNNQQNNQLNNQQNNRQRNHQNNINEIISQQNNQNTNQQHNQHNNQNNQHTNNQNIQNNQNTNNQNNQNNQQHNQQHNQHNNQNNQQHNQYNTNEIINKDKIHISEHMTKRKQNHLVIDIDPSPPSLTSNNNYDEPASAISMKTNSNINQRKRFSNYSLMNVTDVLFNPILEQNNKEQNKEQNKEENKKNISPTSLSSPNSPTTNNVNNKNTNIDKHVETAIKHFTKKFNIEDEIFNTNETAPKISKRNQSSKNLTKLIFSDKYNDDRMKYEIARQNAT